MVRELPLGAGAPVAVESMTKTRTRDPEATLSQIRRLARAGCDLVRVAVPDLEALPALRRIIPHSPIPVMADIHFDYRLALAALKAGVDAVRINPGNIGGRDRLTAVARAAEAAGVPLRIGVNAGSLETRRREKHRRVTAAELAGSLIEQVRIFEELGFEELIVSAKAHDVARTLEVNRRAAAELPYPFHLGVTEAGLPPAATVKSSVALGILLAEGIGDTIRVSLTGEPEEEVRVGHEILRSLGLRERGPVVISCPTCGRVEVDLVAAARQVEKRLAHITRPVTVAVMGCVVNGPGEAREADVGLACGKGKAVLMREGAAIRTVSEEEMVDALVAEVELFLAEGGGSGKDILAD